MSTQFISSWIVVQHLHTVAMMGISLKTLMDQLISSCISQERWKKAKLSNMPKQFGTASDAISELNNTVAVKQHI